MTPPALSLITGAPAVGNAPRPSSDDAVREALQRVLTSKRFAKARRCAALLAYLVERALLCDETAASPPEHEIGVAVFGRDPASYLPADDPIVRVQAGRLRLRLTAYYADEGAADPFASRCRKAVTTPASHSPTASRQASQAWSPRRSCCSAHSSACAETRRLRTLLPA